MPTSNANEAATKHIIRPKTIKKPTNKQTPPIIREKNWKLISFFFEIKHSNARTWKTI